MRATDSRASDQRVLFYGLCLYIFTLVVTKKTFMLTRINGSVADLQNVNGMVKICIFSIPTCLSLQYWKL